MLRRAAIYLGLTSAFLIAAPLVQAADAPAPKGFFSFGPDQTITDIDQVEWQALKLEGLPPGIEIASLRGDLAKSDGEILLRIPANYTVPNHSPVSDELY